MSHQSGIHVHKPVEVCMVVDCDRVALYRSQSRTARGYCKVHKALAVMTTRPFSEETERGEHEMDVFVAIVERTPRPR